MGWDGGFEGDLCGADAEEVFGLGFGVRA